MLRLSERTFLRPLALDLSETIPSTSFPQQEPSSSDNARGSLEIPFNVSDGREPVLSDLAAWGHELDELLKLRRTSAACAAQVPKRMSRSQIRFPPSARPHTMRRSASEGEKRALNADYAVPLNDSKASKKTENEELLAPKNDKKRDVHADSSDRIDVRRNAKRGASKYITTPTSPALRFTHTRPEEGGQVDSPQTKNQPVDRRPNDMSKPWKGHPNYRPEVGVSRSVRNTLPIKPLAVDLLSMYGATTRLSLTETHNEKHDDTRMKVRRGSVTSAVRDLSGLFRSGFTIPSEHNTLEPSVDAAGLPVNSGNNLPMGIQRRPTEKEYAELLAYDVAAYRSKRQSITSKLTYSGRSDKGPASSHSSFKGPTRKEAGIACDLGRDTACSNEMQLSRRELRPETVIKLLAATVKKIICSEAIVNSPARSRLDRTIHAWHELGTGKGT